ncbi:MAG: hypothetical protein Q8O37_16490 [Sulfuricellaceae bacterium]|nr:hypothetical protein [Sulfuricellaceae bacterium]
MGGMNEKSFPPIHFFRPGRHTAMSGQVLEFSAADLSACAQAYDPAVYQAPIVVGHPAVDAPAYGWVSGIEDKGAELYASANQIEPQFADMVRDGRFKKVSGAFFPPAHPRNPVPGVWYLKHIGFLGAAAPAVPGLTPVEYALEDDASMDSAHRLVTIEFSETPETPSLNLPEGEPPMSNPHPPSTGSGQANPPPKYPEGHKGEGASNERLTELEAENAALAQQLAGLKTRETEFAEAQTRLVEIETTARRNEIASFVGSLVSSGRVLPVDQSALCAFMESAGEDDVIAFANPSTGSGQAVSMTSNTWLREWLGRLPVQVDFAERSAGQGELDEAPVFAAPAGFSEDKSQAGLFKRAKLLAKEKNITFAAAVAEISNKRGEA